MICCEEGFIRVVNLSDPFAPRISRPFPAHANAVFDACWAQEDTRLLLASGDQSVSIWSIAGGEMRRVGQYLGHRGSVKAICAEFQGHRFATGSRDGNVMLWDMRAGFDCSAGAVTMGPLETRTRVHTTAASAGVPLAKRRRVEVDSQQSVTCVRFSNDDSLLITGGAVDGSVKIWDARMLGAEPLVRINHVSPRGRAYGITAIDLDASGHRLLTSSSDSCIRVFDISSPAAPLVGTYMGHVSSSFYIRTRFSPDGRFIASGSSAEHKVFIWDTVLPENGPLTLEGHMGEVSAIDWARGLGDPLLASCSDDATVRVWTIPRSRAQEQGREGQREPSPVSAVSAERWGRGASGTASVLPAPEVKRSSSTVTVYSQGLGAGSATQEIIADDDDCSDSPAEGGASGGGVGGGFRPIIPGDQPWTGGGVGTHGPQPPAPGLQPTRLESPVRPRARTLRDYFLPCTSPKPSSTQSKQNQAD